MKAERAQRSEGRALTMKDMLIAIPADCDEDDRSYLALRRAEGRWRILNGYSRGEGGRGLLRHRGSPAKLVINANADQVFGERH